MVKPIDQTVFAPIRTERYNGVANVWEVTVQPPEIVGGQGGTIVLSLDQYDRYKRWRAGEGMIQDMFPDLTPTEREVLLNGDPLGD